VYIFFKFKKIEDEPHVRTGATKRKRACKCSKLEYNKVERKGSGDQAMTQMM